MQQTLKGTNILNNNSQVTFGYKSELSPEKRLLMLTRVFAIQSPQYRELNLKTVYMLNLYTKSLVEGPAKPEPDLSSDDSSRYLAGTKTLDIKSPAFQQWLSQYKLRRYMNESDLEFAWRAYLEIRRQGSYFFDPKQDRRISMTCTDAKTDCGGLSSLFAGTMRANLIPARLLVGRWLKEDGKSDGESPGLGQVHVKSEFFAHGIGWVPVDMSLAVSEKTADPLKFFGKFDGNFVTLHIDPDLVLDSIYFGTSEIPWMQSPLYWVTGGGNLDGVKTETTWQTHKQ
jgi:transglutaminase-like putative cysteine protease